MSISYIKDSCVVCGLVFDLFDEFLIQIVGPRLNVIDGKQIYVQID